MHSLVTHATCNLRRKATLRKLKLALVTLGALAVLALPGTAAAKAHSHASDRNRDRLPDRWEKRYHLSLQLNQALKDPDRDGLTNLREYRDHTNPRDADTDNDGVNDGDENDQGTDPTDPDADDGGVLDGQDDVSDDPGDDGAAGEESGESD